MAVPETTARATAALDELYRQHVGDVYRYTYAVLGNHADAEDVTQTTFVNALRALERGETPEDPSRWLVVIAHNLVRQRWRQAAARPALVELESDVPDGSEDEEGAYELEELVRALQRIPEMQREALVMRELEGRSYREIATLLELSTSALETLLFRARRSLADELENVVTCQNAELAISKRLDGRLSRKERRRLEEHLADCPECSRLAAAEARQRRALKGLALLPLPIGLALFKGAPSAAAATSLPTIGLGTAGAGTSGTGAAGAGTGAGTATGGATVGGSLASGIAVKVAAIAATVAVATGVGYKGVQALRGSPSQQVAAHVEVAPAPAPRTAPSRPATSVGTRPSPPQKPAARAKHAVSSGATVAGTEHAQAMHGASQPQGQAHEATVTGQAGRATTVPTDHAKSSEGSSDAGTSGPTHAGSTNDAKSPTVSTAPVEPKPKPTPTPKPAAPTSGSSLDTPKKPAAGQADTGKAPPPAPVGSGSASGTDTSTPAPAPSGSTATSGSAGSPSPSTPPSAPGGTASGGTAPGTTPPASAPPASPPPTTPPPTTPPPTTPPSSAPPTTPPSTPPAEQPPGGSGLTGGDTSGSSDGAGSGSGNPSSNAADPWDQGRKLGHHKGNHDDKHPGDS